MAEENRPHGSGILTEPEVNSRLNSLETSISSIQESLRIIARNQANGNANTPGNTGRNQDSFLSTSVNASRDSSTNQAPPFLPVNSMPQITSNANVASSSGNP